MRQQVIGRDAELEAVDRFLESVSAGAASLIVEGEPGIGKTTVWSEGVRLAEERGFHVLACRPAESETKLSFSALADLVEPLPDDALEFLPEPQRHALEVALLRVSPGDSPPEPRALAAGFRSLLVGLAQARPLVVAIDDAQWLDSSSARAIEFALRRIAAEPIAVLAARRPGQGLEQALGGLRPLRLGPLSLAAIQHLIKRELGRSLPRPLLARIHKTAEGNPFFALEIARVVMDSDISPGAPLPVPRDLSELVLRRVERLAPPTREVLLTASALANPTRGLLGAVHDGDVSRALEEAEDAKIVDTHETNIRFAHPLYAAAVYASASHERRRRLHSRLAEVVDELEERVRHLALATTEGTDEPTAVAVHTAAREVAARGAPAAAAELVEHALRLGASGTAAETERIVDLAEYLHAGGDSHRARQVLESVESWREKPAELQARAYLLLLELIYWTEAALVAVEFGEQALADAAAPEVAAAIHAKVAEVCEFDLERAAEHADAALALLERMGEDADQDVLALALAMRARNRLALGHGLERELVERAIALERTPHAAHAYGQWLKYVDDLDGARYWLGRSLQEAEEAGDETSVPNILQQLAMTECWAGRLGLAREYAVRACEMAEDLEIISVGVYRVRAIVEAHLGNDAEVRKIAERLWAEGWDEAILQHLEIALGLLELSLGNAEEADRHLRAAVEIAERMGQLEPGIHRVHGDALEAALAVGDHERANEIAAWLEAHGRRSGHAWSVAIGARSRALVEAKRGEFDAALASVEAALLAQERLPMPFELARTLLAKGQIERRAKRRREARESLERSLAIFEGLGARLWAQRAASELRRVPIRRGVPSDLTEGEVRVAELAATGKTNREVAQELFMSPKTVEANLSRVYRKLGIHSRAELGARMAERSRGEGAAKP
jgi:DNA-binding CsgD family transcriptional regulator